ncbi:MAG: EVE domain-containing protein [Alphaproteobacteria bacterium]|nr:EVE domain-containing protein [Alphaproteobacteria bacterium]
MAHWLVKSEPGCWSWADHVRNGVERWDGVRNHQAANSLKSMQIGDMAFFYHSVTEKRIVGTLEVVKEAYIDPTDAAGRFVCVDFAARQALARPVSLADIKTNPDLDGMWLLRQSRLSVTPITEAQWDAILAMAGGLADD